MFYAFGGLIFYAIFFAIAASFLAILLKIATRIGTGGGHLDWSSAFWTSCIIIVMNGVGSILLSVFGIDNAIVYIIVGFLIDAVVLSTMLDMNLFQSLTTAGALSVLSWLVNVALVEFLSSLETSP